MRNCFVFSIVIFIASCKSNIDIEYIKSTGWSYDKVYRVTDFISFKQGLSYSINGDTIIFENKPRAIIISLDKGAYDLTIKSLDGKNIGHYMDEREMSK